MQKSFNFLTITLSIFVASIYWNAWGIAGVRVPVYTLSLALLIFNLLVHINYSKHLMGVLATPLYAFLLFTYLILMSTGLINPGENFLLIFFKMTFIVAYVFLLSQAIYIYVDQQQGSLSAVAMSVTALFFIYMIWFSEPLNLLDVIDSALAGDFVNVSRIWRSIFLGELFVPGVHVGQNFRNGLAAALFVVITMLSSGQFRLLNLIAIGVLAAVILSLFSQSGTLFLAVAGLSFLFRYRFALKFEKFVLFCLTAVLIFGLSYVVDVLDTQRISERFDASASARLIIYQAAWDEIMLSPLLGHGVGQKIYIPSLGVEYYAHNHFLTIWHNAGLLGITVFSLFYITLVFGILRFITGYGLPNDGREFLYMSASVALLPAALRVLVGSSYEGLFSIGSATGVAYFVAINYMARLRGRSRRTFVQRTATPATVT